MTRRIPNLAVGTWLVVLWVLLWGELTPANVLGGVAVAVGVLVAVPRPAPLPASRGERSIIRPLRFASLLAWFTWKLVEANLKVALAVVRPSSSEMRTALVRVDLPGCTPGIVTLVANGVSLTPGTLTIEVDEAVPSLLVHVMQFEGEDALRRDVWELERRTVAAVGSASARAAVAERTAAPAPAPAPEGTEEAR